ncbi:MAG TPA: NAD-glutamate dehydrogenase [Rhizomicrobium sp.]|nr:NAD-glutamate dehydrogenase [Rhizomicrobium sp.]
MNLAVQEKLSASDEAEAAGRLAASAGAAQLDPDLKSFFEALYRNAAPEDINRYTPDALAALARMVWRRAAKRGEGQILVDVFAPADEDKAYGLSESALVAVNDDMPFLFDSLTGELHAQGARLRAVFHPVIRRGESSVSVIVAILDPILDAAKKQALVDGARAVFEQVRTAVRDWRAMLDRLKRSIGVLKAHPPRIPREQLDESVAFLEWLADNHFTFLGCRDYRFTPEAGGRLDPVEQSGLGVLADTQARVAHRGSLTPQIIAFLMEPEPIIITKSNERSLVHRRVHMDYVGVKIFDTNGALAGERRFVGLFTSGAYSMRPGDIPLLRRKVENVKRRAGLAPNSHDGKALAHILDTFPRDELFQISEDELFHTALGILRLGERPKVRVFLRFDRFDRFVSALVYVPRDRYDTQARERIHAILAKAFNGRMSASTPTIDESALSRVYYIVGRNDGPRPQASAAALEAEIRAAIRTWDDGFADALAAAHGESEAARLLHARDPRFSPGYTGIFAPDEAVRDLDEILTLAAGTGGRRIKARAYRKDGDARNALRLKLYLLDEVMPLSASLPVFENLGMKVIAEDAFSVAFNDEAGVRRESVLLDFQMERADQGAAPLEEIKAPLEEAFHAVVSGEAESDGFNRLVLCAELSWRDVTILRAAVKYLRQATIAFSQEYMEQALSRNPDIARLLVELFHALHDPGLGEGRDARVKAVEAKIEKALNDVPSLDDDRIIRRLRNVIASVLRTNYYQRGQDGAPRPTLAIKLDSQQLDELPAPRPHVEIFVYAPQVEGVHLRFGKVARGGIRWSDRREDFRTEVLGLVKAQQVKNAVIVPVGAKGGFYAKQVPANATRDETQAAGVAAYKLFIDALLDLTDNLHPDGSVVPAACVRRDDDDPYLVVAADKGTATFSDIANGIAEARGFWLGDAFASGGSHGYDHKKMGITAKGAWEAVKRHFREMGRDIQNEPFTAIGVGDMSGDVFGNGMLLSKFTRLLAAFDHRHIFIDPDPDAARSWDERKRLFDLPRSSWDDYDKNLISKGGGVYPRTLKEIVLSPEVKALTGLSGNKATPAELMNALLKAPVDLLWFGGIGTYVKASSQTNQEAGDRANDAIRVNGREIRAKVIGEGANLGCTQLGRIEYAIAGGRINTDAIDNSAGVDTSDHEVNLKILLSGPMRRGEIAARARDEMLAAMTDDVARHVLQDNYDQTLTLSVAEARASKDLDAHGRYMRDLESRGKLDRAVEFLPDDAQLRIRAQSDRGLTRPELAVLLAYSKLDLKAELSRSPLLDDAHFTAELASYFPKLAVEKFRGEMESHRLRREIIADVLANRLINLAGPVFVARMKEMTGASGAEVMRVSVVAEGAFGLSNLKARVDALDGKVDAATQISMYTDIAELLRRLGLWFLANVPANADFASTIALYRAGVDRLRGSFEGLVSEYEKQETLARIAELEKAGAPHDLADEIGALPLFGTAPEIAQLANANRLGIDLVAGVYFAIGAEVGIDRLRGLSRRIVGVEHWDRLAIRRLNDDLFAAQRALTSDALKLIEPGSAVEGDRRDGAELAKRWVETHRDALSRARSFLAVIESAGELSIAKLTLANSQIRELAGR